MKSRVHERSVRLTLRFPRCIATAFRSGSILQDLLRELDKALQPLLPDDLRRESKHKVAPSFDFENAPRRQRDAAAAKPNDPKAPKPIDPAVREQPLACTSLSLLLMLQAVAQLEQRVEGLEKTCYLDRQQVQQTISQLEKKNHELADSNRRLKGGKPVRLAPLFVLT